MKLGSLFFQPVFDALFCSGMLPEDVARLRSTCVEHNQALAATCRGDRFSQEVALAKEPNHFCGVQQTSENTVGLRFNFARRCMVLCP